MDSWERFKEESLPDKEYFYSKLSIEHITDEDYAHTQKVFFVFCFCFCFFLSGFSFTKFTNHRTAEEGGGYFFNSSLPLPPASQTLRH